MKFVKNLRDSIVSKVHKQYGPSVSDYENEPGNWQEDRYAILLNERNRYVQLTFLFGAMAILMLIALITLLPLKRVDKVFIAIDKQVGQPLVINPVPERHVAENQALVNHMLAKFLESRLSFNSGTINDDLNIVRLMSTPEVYAQYKQYLSKSNEASPFNTLSEGERSIKIERIMSLRKNQAVVLFQQIDKTKSSKSVTQVTAYINYRFTTLELTQNEAEVINPVGFQVTGFRVQTATVLGDSNEK